MSAQIGIMQRIARFCYRSPVNFAKKYFTASNELIDIVWKNKDGSTTTTKAMVGESLLIAAHKNNIEVEGACEGVCACSTCHVILEKTVYDGLPEASEDEEDMLDQAFGLTPTSRLGCQVIVGKEHNGILVTLPNATRNFYVVSTAYHLLATHKLQDGHVPKPH